MASRVEREPHLGERSNNNDYTENRQFGVNERRLNGNMSNNNNYYYFNNTKNGIENQNISTFITSGGIKRSDQLREERDAISTSLKRAREVPILPAPEEIVMEKRPKLEVDTGTDKRNRRLFGGLLGHLKAAKTQLAAEKDSEQALKHRLQEERVEEKLAMSRRNISEIKRRVAEVRRLGADLQRYEVVDTEVAVRDNEVMRHNLIRHYEHVKTFIGTEAQPTLFWTPAVWCDRSKKLQERTQHWIEMKIRSLEETDYSYVESKNDEIGAVFDSLAKGFEDENNVSNDNEDRYTGDDDDNNNENILSSSKDNKNDNSGEEKEGFNKSNNIDNSSSDDDDGSGNDSSSSDDDDDESDSCNKDNNDEGNKDHDDGCNKKNDDGCNKNNDDAYNINNDDAYNNKSENKDDGCNKNNDDYNDKSENDNENKSNVNNSDGDFSDEKKNSEINGNKINNINNEIDSAKDKTNNIDNNNDG